MLRDRHTLVSRSWLLGLTALALLLVLAAAAAQLGLWQARARIDGVSAQARAWTPRRLERIARGWQDKSLRLHVGYHEFQPTHAQLGWALRVDDALHELATLGPSANPLVTLRGLWLDGIAAGHALRWRPRLHDAAAFDAYIERLRDQIDRLPVPGSYAPDGAPIDGLPGEALDTAAVKRAIERALARGDAELQVETLVTPAPLVHRAITQPLAASNVLMMSQSTQFRPHTGRAHNIELAARKLDGTLLMPGAAFSFNQVVGKRELSRGFAPALELVRGELVQGVGGGVCQTAGTVHAAAFFAGLIVDEYHAHSRLNRLAYLQPGLDAMVAWPDDVSELRDTKDMRLRNPYPFPVLIRATTESSGERGVLRVELYGSAKPYRVDFQFKVLERVPSFEIRRADATLSAGTVRVQQEGLEGLVIARRRTIYTPLRRIEEETRVSYPPTPRIVLTSPAALARD